MPGALTLLSASGDGQGADAFLNGNPNGTLFKDQFKRYTPYAAEDLEILFSGAVGFGQRSTAIVGRMGDLLSNTYLQITLPDLANFTPVYNGEPVEGKVVYANASPLACIDYIELEIGGCKVDRITADVMFQLQRLQTPTEKELAINRMTGYIEGYEESFPRLANTEGGVYYVPLPFFFSANMSQALPLAALSYSEVRINVYWKQWQDVIRTENPITSLMDDSNQPIQLAAQMYGRYILLGDQERRRIQTSPLEYLYVQHNQNIPKPVNSGAVANLRLDLLALQNPVASLLLTYQDSAATTTDTVLGNRRFDYAMAGAAGQDPIDTLKMQINGIDLGVVQAGSYYRLLQTYDSWPSCHPDDFLYTYNFATQPGDTVQPTGAANFSRMDAVAIYFSLNPAYATADNQGTVTVNALSWQLLRIKDGFATQVFST